PLDPLERAERRLDRGPLAIRAEVRAQPGPQVARAAGVEHLVVLVAEEVDAGRRRRAEGERPLEVDAASARRGELAQVGDARRAALLCEADQGEEGLGGSGRVRQRAVVLPCACVEG